VSKPTERAAASTSRAGRSGASSSQGANEGALLTSELARQIKEAAWNVLVASRRREDLEGLGVLVLRVAGRSQEAAEREIREMIDDEVAAYEAYMESLQRAMQSSSRPGDDGDDDEDPVSEE
jgi:hypothetical protein